MPKVPNGPQTQFNILLRSLEIEENKHCINDSLRDPQSPQQKFFSITSRAFQDLIEHARSLFDKHEVVAQQVREMKKTNAESNALKIKCRNFERQLQESQAQLRTDGLAVSSTRDSASQTDNTHSLHQIQGRSGNATPVLPSSHATALPAIVTDAKTIAEIQQIATTTFEEHVQQYFGPLLREKDDALRRVAVIQRINDQLMETDRENETTIKKLEQMNQSLSKRLVESESEKLKQELKKTQRENDQLRAQCNDWQREKNELEAKLDGMKRKVQSLTDKEKKSKSEASSQVDIALIPQRSGSLNQQEHQPELLFSNLSRRELDALIGSLQEETQSQCMQIETLERRVCQLNRDRDQEWRKQIAANNRRHEMWQEVSFWRAFYWNQPLPQYLQQSPLPPPVLSGDQAFADSDRSNHASYGDQPLPQYSNQYQPHQIAFSGDHSLADSNSSDDSSSQPEDNGKT